MFKLDLEKAEEPEIKLPTSATATAVTSVMSDCPIPGILQAGTLEWVAISFSNT